MATRIVSKEEAINGKEVTIHSIEYGDIKEVNVKEAVVSIPELGLENYTVSDVSFEFDYRGYNDRNGN